MNALLVIAHPSPSSFTHAMADVAAGVLSESGYALTRHDLYAQGFNPVQPTVESANTTSADALVEAHCADLSKADLILIFHPNWWSQPPAILKGWIDRVFRLNTAYGYPDGVGTRVSRWVCSRQNTPLSSTRQTRPQCENRRFSATPWRPFGEPASLLSVA